MSRKRLAVASGCLVLLAPFALGQSIGRIPGSGITSAPSGPGVVELCSTETFTQSTSLVPITNHSVGCITGSPNFFHRDNSWWRAFPLFDSGLEGGFSVCQVEFTIETSVSPGTALQPLTVNLYENSGCAFPRGTRTLLGTTTVDIADQTLGTVLLPVTGYAPAGSELVVELHVPDGVAQMRRFAPGSNPAGQTGPTYISSDFCSLPDPTDVADIGFGDMHLILTVIGVEDGVAPKAIALTGTASGLLEPGVPVTVVPSWKNNTGFAQTFTGTASLIAPSGYTGQTLDGAADYGTVADGATADCASASGNCYQIQIDGPVATGHHDATLDEAMNSDAVAAATFDRTRTLHIGSSFDDVATSNIFYPFIETLLHREITAGCVGFSYCPTNTTLRQQMAVFLLKAVEGACYQPPPATGVFTDVPAAGPFAPFIEELASRGITGGCGPDLFCPASPIKRKQMAVFLLKALEGSSYVPPAAAHIFSDVPQGDPFEPWIEELFNRQIAAGCGPGVFCPENPVNRGQMAPFLVKTFGLVLYAP